MSQFTLNLSKQIAQAKENAHLVVQKVILDLSTRMVERSPVGNPSLWKNPAPKGYTGGRFRANWQLGIGVIPSRNYNMTDKTGAVSIVRIGKTIPKDAAGHLYYIVNPLPYGQRLEDGWSTQAPGGMVALTVLEFRGLVTRRAREVRDGR